MRELFRNLKSSKLLFGFSPFAGLKILKNEIAGGIEKPAARMPKFMGRFLA